MKGKFEFLIEICETFLLGDEKRKKKKKRNNSSFLSHLCITCGAEKIDKTFVIEQLNIHTRHFATTIGILNIYDFLCFADELQEAKSGVYELLQL
jgi:hypothetical protein